MLILFTITILFLSALALLYFRLFNPEFRYSWLIAALGMFFAWISIFFWHLDMPIVLTLPSWQPENLFLASPVFLADRLSWGYAFSIATLGLGTIFTAVARENFPSHPAWAGTLALSTIGILAVLAENPLTLVLAWTAIDLVELITLLSSIEERELRERVVISFSIRVIGSGFLLWAGQISIAEGGSLNFIAAPQKAGIYMLIASGLRLGILPMHMPFRAESALRRGYGTMLRLTSAASSLILFARIPYSSIQTPFITVLLGVVSLIALYGGWMWFRSTKTLDARPYWILGMASLSLAATLYANPVGSVAWGIALVLGGGVLFLSSVQKKRLNYFLLSSLIAMTALPMTLTASAWESKVSQPWFLGLLLLLAQALLLAGYFHHARHTDKSTFENQSGFARLVYPLGIGLMIFCLFLLGFWGWQGAASIGAWLFGIGGILIAAFFIWLRPRIRSLNPLQVHWLKPDTNANRNILYDTLWGGYIILRNMINQITNILESDGGILWALLFIILFASLLAEGIR